MLRSRLQIILRKARLSYSFPLQVHFLPKYSIGSIKLLPRIQENVRARIQEEAIVNLPNNEKEWVQNVLTSVVPEYPFVNLPSVSIQSLINLKVEEELKQMVIAWKCLENKNKDQLKKAYQYLLPEKHHLQFIDKKISYVGEAIFTDYFEKQLPKMIEKINSNNVGRKEKIGYLNTLAHMKSSMSLKDHIRLIKPKALQKIDQSMLFAVMISLKARNGMPYADYLNLLEELFVKKGEEQQIPNIRVGYYLALVPYFYRYYPRPILKAIFIIFRAHLKKMSNPNILQMLKKVYQNNSKYARLLAEDLINLMKGINPSKDSSRAKDLLPLLFKIIDYCQVLEVSPSELIFSTISRIGELGPAISHEGLSQQLLIIKLYRYWHSGIPPEYLVNLQKFIVGRLREFETASQINEQQLVGLSKLIYQFRRQISIASGAQCAVNIIQLITRINQFHPYAFYQCLKSVLSLQYLFRQQGNYLNPQKIQQLKTLLRTYFYSSCQKVTGSLLIVKNVNQMINLVAQMRRCGVVLPEEDFPNICAIKFKDLKQYSMDIETLSNLLAYLAQFKLNNHLELLKVLPQLQYIVFSFFNSQQMSFKATLDILQIASSCNFYNSNLYNKIQKAIFEIIQKYPQFRITPAHLRMIKQSMGEKGLGHANFNNFINSSIEEPDKWEQHRHEYIQKEAAFHRKKHGKYTNRAQLQQQQ